MYVLLQLKLRHEYSSRVVLQVPSDKWEKLQPLKWLALHRRMLQLNLNTSAVMWQGDKLKTLPQGLWGRHIHAYKIWPCWRVRVEGSSSNATLHTETWWEQSSLILEQIDIQNEHVHDGTFLIGEPKASSGWLHLLFIYSFIIPTGFGTPSVRLEYCRMFHCGAYIHHTLCWKCSLIVRIVHIEINIYYIMLQIS